MPRLRPGLSFGQGTARQLDSPSRSGAPFSSCLIWQLTPPRERRGFSLDTEQRLIGTSIACHEITFRDGLVATLLDYQDLEVKLRIGGKECCWHRYLSHFGR